MNYSRHSPSARYLELVKMYQEMHEVGERFRGYSAENTFDGRSLKPQARRIKRLIESTGALRILDYGSGKGRQYDTAPFTSETGQAWDTVMDYWGVDEVLCFDPGYAPFSKLPEGRFDGVICTDVLEHCPEEDLGWIVGEIFGYAERFVFATIACYPAKKRLPNGENAHCTIRPAQWWQEKLASVAAAYPAVQWEAWVQSKESGPMVDTRIGSTSAESA
jgi:hypothetical protein